MQKKLNKYFRFWFLIDLVGVAFSIILILSYLEYSEKYDEKIQNLWSNLAIEVLGVWLSVRIIDYLLERFKNFKTSRFHQLRNLQYFYDTSLSVYEYDTTYEGDIEKLQLEIKYFDKRWDSRSKHFYHDEIKEIMVLRDSMPQIIETCLLARKLKFEIRNLEEKFPINEEEKSHLVKLKNEKNDIKSTLKSQLLTFLKNLENVRENVWEETHPDD